MEQIDQSIRDNRRIISVKISSEMSVSHKESGAEMTWDQMREPNALKIMAITWRK
jgi:hypothetical protein